MRNAKFISAITLILLAPVSGTSAQEEVEVPPAIKEAFSPGSELYNNAIDLLEYQDSITAADATRARSLTAEDAASALVTYGTPIRTAYFEFELSGSGPITESDLSDLPDRYVAVQYVGGQIEGSYVVDVEGSFIEMGTESETVTSAFETWPAGSIYVTGTPFLLGAAVSPDGHTVTPITGTAREAMGGIPMSAESFRHLVAEKVRELREEEALAPTDGGFVTAGIGGSALTKSPAMSFVLLGGGAVLVAGLACLFVRSRRRS